MAMQMASHSILIKSVLPWCTPVHVELIWDWLKQWDCRQMLHLIEPNPSPIWPVLLCVAWKPYCKPGLPSLINHPWSKHTCARMSYERTNKSIDANKILQILTKLCFLFRWVIFNWISSSLHPPARAHPLKQRLPQSGSLPSLNLQKGIPSLRILCLKN